MYENIEVVRTSPVATLTMNRPERRNALSLRMMEEIIDGLHSISADRGVHAVILRANGPAFSAGHDLSEMIGRPDGEYRKIFDVCTEMMALVHEIPQPVIAEVAGVATAAGCQLVAACDLAVASEKATFATPGVRIGLFCTTPMVEVSRAIGRKRALEMLLTGRPVDARTAESWGLVNRVAPEEGLAEETRQLAESIAEASPYTMTLGKRAFYAQIDLGREHAYDYAKRIMAGNAAADDAQEGMKAFLEKRRPVWTGK